MCLFLLAFALCWIYKKIINERELNTENCNQIKENNNNNNKLTDSMIRILIRFYVTYKCETRASQKISLFQLYQYL